MQISAVGLHDQGEEVNCRSAERECRVDSINARIAAAWRQGRMIGGHLSAMPDFVRVFACKSVAREIDGITRWVVCITTLCPDGINDRHKQGAAQAARAARTRRRNYLGSVAVSGASAVSSRMERSGRSGRNSTSTKAQPAIAAPTRKVADSAWA
jgi:hypothetical protein